MKIIKNAKIFDGEKIINNCNIMVSGTKIKQVTENNIDSASETQVIDAAERLVSPGFIDIHLHGADGYDAMDGTVEAIQGISRAIARYGTTSFLPTTLTMSIETINKSLDTVKLCMHSPKGANILGVHLEGPFINKFGKGAQNEKYILQPSVENYKRLVGENEDIVRRITIAPEVDGAGELLKYLKSIGVCTSAGHTAATIDEFNIGTDLGITLCTHLFNGMCPLEHRNPGVVGGSLVNDCISVEFIADLVHIDKNVLKLITKCKKPESCILISDALSASCKGEGSFRLGDQEVIVKKGEARLKTGSLAGSVIMINQAIKNMVNAVGISLESALKMATVNPAAIIGVDGFKGRIKEDYDADIVILNDRLDVEKVMIMGKIYEQ